MSSIEAIKQQMDDAQKTYYELKSRLDQYEALAHLPPPAVGAKLKWVSASNPETYRIAIVTKTGVLQVKSMTDGEGECDITRTVGGTHPLIKKMFACEADWRASLPSGGTTTLSFPGKVASAPSADEAFPRLSDVEKVSALIKRYKVWHRVMKNRSRQECLDAAVARLDHFRATMNTLSYDQMFEQGLFSSNRRGFQCLLKIYSWCRDRVADAGVDANAPRFHYGRSGTGAIHAMINGQPHLITVYEDKIAAVLTSDYCGQVTFYKNFAEMGNPAIFVMYRKRIINI